MDVKRIRRMVKVERLICRDAREELKITVAACLFCADLYDMYAPFCEG